MKFLALTALIAVAQAQDEAAEGEAAAVLAAGESCADNKSGCDAGLCCGEGIYKDDVVDGEVQEGYDANAVIICHDEAADEYANADGEEYYFSCMEVSAEGNAKYLVVSAMAVASIAYAML